MERMREIQQSSRKWEEGSIKGSDWLGSRNWARLGRMGFEWCRDWNVGTISVSSGGCRQRRQHQHLIRSDQNGVQGEGETF